MTDSQQYMDQIGKVFFQIQNCFCFIIKSLPVLFFVLQYLAFSCGLIRGALFNLGISSVVTADVSQPPSVKFQIKIHT